MNTFNVSSFFLFSCKGFKNREITKTTLHRFSFDLLLIDEIQSWKRKEDKIFTNFSWNFVLRQMREKEREISNAFQNSMESNVGRMTWRELESRAGRSTSLAGCSPFLPPSPNTTWRASKRARGGRRRWCIAGRDRPAKEDFVARIVFWRVLTNGRHYTGTEPKGALRRYSGKPGDLGGRVRANHTNDPTKQLHHRKPLLWSHTERQFSDQPSLPFVYLHFSSFHVKCSDCTDRYEIFIEYNNTFALNV